MIIVIIIIAITVFFIYKSKSNNPSTENKTNKEHRVIKQINKEFSNMIQNSNERSKQELIKKTRSVYYRNPSDFIMFDDTKKTVSFNKGTFNYNQIMGYTMYVDTDDKHLKGAGGALTGGLLMGPVGAVVGGLARHGVDKSKFKSCGVKIKIGGKTYDIQTSKRSDKNTKGKKIAKSKSISTAIEDAKMISTKLENVLK
ncbi:hypothetical protein GCM10025879_20370 [Leuconostoc litchii]|uniref:Uncharacterized protein n=1 Tax=Leuconostoc litchii TaxID=1981069 RepID=A0A6P2CR74_9LACO|nr:hypothetical protein [Leuconostoc litchii]TYC46827.1 hypothetical protein ESZ47_01415 [Leuconostoc litchii]GMA70721.1 hypothetical protein GCM10025879_19670 [Leuconostoc litchii]GMA70791.1 hypothetical protein GCM10025879_20370 [Leuconostoc litchii]